MRLTGNYFLNIRNLAIVICVLFLTLSAQAQTPEDKNWTTVGSAGTLDESSVGKVFFDQSKAQMGRVIVGNTPAKKRALLINLTQSAVIRYNVTPVDGFFVLRNCSTSGSRDVQLRLRYLASGPNARVVAKLIEVDLATGSEKSLLTFDSNAPGLPHPDASRVQAAAVCGRPWTFDFENKAYYVEGTLTTSSILAGSAAGIQVIQIDNTIRRF